MSGIPGLIPKEQIAQIAAGIREFGFTNPILIDDKQGVIAWYGRLAVARKNLYWSRFHASISTA